MKNLSFLIKPASSSCNLKCRYCFYADVSKHRDVVNHGIMKDSTTDALLRQTFEHLDEEGTVTFAFQGGEPTVAGIDYFQKFCEKAEGMKKEKQKVSYAIQTNGYLLDQQWCELLKKYDFLTGVSLDGYKDNHDYFRISGQNTATYKTVRNAIDLLKKNGVRFNVLTVLSRQLAKHPERLYKFYRKEQISYIQLIPCLAGLEEDGNPYALTPELFADFYKTFFDCWFEDYQKGIYRSIGLFDNLIPMFADIPPYQCGMLGFCRLQLVVESDGSVYPCDFYVLDRYNGGNIEKNSLPEILNSEPMRKFVAEKKPRSQCCKTCRFESLCHGNCKRMTQLYFNDHYCGYQDFLNYASGRMAMIARTIK